MEYRECTYEKCGNPVFARGICRKHYDRERLAKADPCSIDNCTAPASKRGMCDSHYQAWRIRQQPLCKVDGCTEHAKGPKYGLCMKHESRFRNHQTFEQTRPADWGSRYAHPLYGIWHWHKRYSSLCKEWHDDFWVFVEAVGPDKPGNHTLRSNDHSAPLGPGNWFWKESIDSSDKAMYARKWRAINAEKAKDGDLKKSYGIGIKEYRSMFLEQYGVCKICGKREANLDRNGSPISLAIDHCHETGRVRGLLCSNCNRGMGFLKDNADILRKAAEYIEENAT